MSTTTSSPNDAPATSSTATAGTSTAANVHKSPDQQHLNRACEACRFHKVRCLPEPSTPGKCQRCAKSNRECVFAAPQRRRPRRRAEARMAELEKEVRQMRALLKDSGGGQASDDDELPGRVGSESDGHSPNLQGPGIAGPGTEPPPRFMATLAHGRPAGEHPPSDVPGTPGAPGMPPPLNKVPGMPPVDAHAPSIFSPDVVSRGLLTVQQAHKLVAGYKAIMHENCPVLSLPADATPQKLRENSPMLFLAILAASSLRIDSDLAHKLKNELHRAFAELVFIRCEKTRDLVQALVLTVGYYNPPDAVRNIQVFMYSHMAAAMAMDIGLGYKPTTYKTIGKDPKLIDKALKDEALMQDCRLILSCWLMPARVATKARRPSFLPFTSWMQECVYLLEKSTDINDRRLSAWVKLQRIATEATTSFGFDDASTSIVLTPLRLQVIVRAFEKRMAEWHEEFKSLLNVNLRMEYFSNFTSIYEFAMDGGKHEADEFRKRHFSLPSLNSSSADVQPHMPLSPLEVDATVKCITSAHDTLDTFLTLNTQGMRSCPNYFFVLGTYSLAVLLRLTIAFALGSNDLADLVDTQSIKFDYYIEALQRSYSEAAGPENMWVPLHWAHVLGKIQMWYEKNKPKISQHRGIGSYPPRPQPSQAKPHTADESMTANPSMPIPEPTDMNAGATMPGFTPTNAFSPSNGGSAPEISANFNAFNLINPMTSFLDPMDLGNGESFMVNDFHMGFTGWAPPADTGGFASNSNNNPSLMSMFDEQ